MRRILPKESAIGHTVHRCIFFNEIIYDVSFQIPENCRHKRIYSCIASFFCFTRPLVCFHSTDCHKLPMVNPFRNIFGLKHRSPYTSHFSANFAWFALVKH